MKFLAITLLLISLDAMACISLQRRDIQANVVSKSEGGYIIEVTEQTFESKSGKPVSGILKYQFVEDDYDLLFSMVYRKLKDGAPEADLKASLLTTMKGSYDYLSKNKAALIADYKQSGHSAQEVQEYREKVDLQLGKAKEAIDGLNSAGVKASADKFVEAIYPLEIRHQYARTDGGPPVKIFDIFPPQTRSAGCSAAKTNLTGLDLLNDQSGTVVEYESSPDPLLGLSSAMK